MKTRDEIEKLKAGWLEDQGWDLEDSEGFEDHKTELAAYQAQVEAGQRAKAAERHKAMIAELVKPAMEALAVIDTSPLLAHTPAREVKRAAVEIMVRVVAEMLAPLVRRLDRQAEDIAAMQTRHEDELDELRAELRRVR